MEEIPLVQTTEVGHYVFPVVVAKLTKEGLEYIELIGTCFFIGKNGFALTASHVLDQCRELLDDDRIVVAIFAIEKQWVAFQINEVEQHPKEDVAVVRVISKNTKWNSSIITLTHIIATG
jgi:hypothetical protein